MLTTTMRNIQRCPKWLPILLFISSIMLSLLDQHSTIANDTITPNLSLSGNQTLISKSGTFELGFFTTSTGSQNHYLGIWYKKISPGTVVWVANRANPIIGNNGVLNLTQQGDLALLDHNISTIVWYSKSINSTPNEVQNPVAQLLDNGNFVVMNNNGENIGEFLWQSFDYPFDTMLPGMKLGWDLRTGLNRFLSTQKSTKDVSPGDYALGIDIEGVAQLVLWKGKEIKYRAGSWNGLRFTGTPQLNPNPIFSFNFTYNLDEVYYSYELCNNSVVTELVVNQSGLIHRLTWNDRNHAWVLFFVLPSDQCDTYNLCGSHGSCNMDNSPICQCLEGFVPKNARDWSTMDWSGGCVRRTALQCQEGEGFRKYDRVKLPDTRYAMLNKSLNFRECEAECLMNCSCTAYAVADIREGSECLRWFGDLVDMRKLNDNGQEIYIRMASSDLGYVKQDLLGYKVAGVFFLLLLLLLGLAFHIKWKHKKEVKKAIEMKCIPKSGNTQEDPKGDIELPIFDFATIATATNNFSFGNKIGEGGFGPVYKGKLCDGLEIAVKRLSRNSHQGLNEFKNEIILIAKLQHRNLVKLLGSCIQGEEMLLIYEYMPNKSLDLFIFDKIRSLALDWKIRFNIICGIARGLLYLHQDSRLRIIHRDLKASNVLLDDNMVPKISDFGMARTFGGDQSETNTRRVVGTYGYMSPEYAMDGLFSIKSDVFSFGVIMLEIISGKKNKGFYHSNHNSNLLGNAWRLWRDGNPLELVDESIASSCVPSEVLRCIHVALLCVQHYPNDRLSMPLVSLMLISEATGLPTPKAPGFVRRNFHLTESSSSFHQESVTTNEMTISLLEPR